MTEQPVPIRLIDETGIIVDWLLKIIVLLGLAGGLAVEGLGVLIARYNAAEAASAAATQAALALRTGGTPGDPEALARSAAAAHGSELVSLEIDTRSKKVIATVQRRARTFLLHRVRPLENLTIAKATEEVSFESR